MQNNEGNTGNTDDAVKGLYDLLSAHRAEVMGIAILWVVWFHSEVFIDFIPVPGAEKIFLFLKRLGYCGVDIFLFLSGIGVYNSLEKNRLSVFLKHRIRRIVPIWYLELLSCLIILQVPMTLKQIIGFMTFTGFWQDITILGNWYVYTIMFFYLLSPFFHSILSGSKKKALSCLVLVFLAIAVSIQFAGDFKMRVFTRLPIFIIGMYVSAEWKGKKVENVRKFILAAAFLIGLAWYSFIYLFHYDLLGAYGFWWYPLILMVPAMTVFFSGMLETASGRLKIFPGLLGTCGKASLEILLFSAFLFDKVRGIESPEWHHPAVAVLVIVISVAVGILLHGAVDRLLMLAEKGGRSGS